MTEREWLTCTDPRAMADTAIGSPRASDRTCRLFVAAYFTWLALRQPEEPQEKLLRQVASTEYWAENGRPPNRTRIPISEGGIFFNRNAERALRFTLGTFDTPFERTMADPEAVAVQPPLVREIFGNPFRPAAFAPAWRTETAVALAKQMYEARDFGAMPILADALQDAGCDNEDVLDHCRGRERASGEPAGASTGWDGPHVRGCWVVDAVLGKG